MSVPTADNLVELTGVSKHFPGVVALDDVSFALRAGEVRALLGKNGAGKSTLIKVLGGVERPDSGTLHIAGEEVHLKGPRDAIERGIATVHQELACAGELTVTENIVLGRWPRKRFTGIAWKQAEQEAAHALSLIGVDVPLNRPIGRLSLAQIQLVEIVRALSIGARLLILDEPTSSLATHEANHLIEVVKRLSERGIGVIYISHRMDEIERVADSVTVMRDGRNVGDLPMSKTSPREVVELMIGEAREHHRANAMRARRHQPGQVVLSVQGLAVPPKIEEVSFEVRAGEVLGIAGLLGSGRTETIRAIVGAQGIAGGTVTVLGQELTRRTIRSTMRSGVVMTPEDRRGEGAVTILGVDENLVMSSMKKVSRFGVLSNRRRNAVVRRSITDLDIKVARPDAELATLSGGNQQKVVIGKALNTTPAVLLLDEPTRGVDVEAKEQLYGLMRALADDGIGVVFVSSEAEELLDACDRIIVLRNGRIQASVDARDIDRETLFGLMMNEDSNA